MLVRLDEGFIFQCLSGAQSGATSSLLGYDGWKRALFKMGRGKLHNPLINPVFLAEERIMVAEVTRRWSSVTPSSSAPTARGL